jgi:hypothetical protein
MRNDIMKSAKPAPVPSATYSAVCTVRPSQAATPPERNMIARRRWFRYRAPQITQQRFCLREVCQGSMIEVISVVLRRTTEDEQASAER